MYYKSTLHLVKGTSIARVLYASESSKLLHGFEYINYGPSGLAMREVKVLVTGGAGFVGVAIVEKLLEKYPHYILTILDVKPTEQYHNEPTLVTYLQVDLRDAEKVLSTVESVRPTVIVHTAGIIPAGYARYGRETRDAVNEVNIQGTINMINAAKAYNVDAFIYTSSCTIITDDLNNDYPNYCEKTSIPVRSLIYGESKVRVSGRSSLEPY